MKTSAQADLDGYDVMNIYHDSDTLPALSTSVVSYHSHRPAHQPFLREFYLLWMRDPSGPTGRFGSCAKTWECILYDGRCNGVKEPCEIEDVRLWWSFLAQGSTLAGWSSDGARTKAFKTVID
jgi:hypothetical protein